MMSEVVRKIQWRWITEERRFFTIYRGWRCYVWQSDPGKLWEFSADYYDDTNSRGIYSCAATQSEAQTAALDAVNWEIDAKK